MDTQNNGTQGQHPPTQAPEYQNYAPPQANASMEDMIKWDEYQRKLRRGRFLKFPYPVFVTMLYLFIGSVFGWWHPGWLLFLSIPIYYGMAAGI